MVSRCWRRAWLLPHLAILALALPVAAQEVGALRGTVTEAGTARPLSGAHVLVTGTGQAALSDEAGNFMISGVPVGTHRVQVEMIGYATAAQTVTVVGGTGAVVTFELRQAAIQLDQIVVTGTAGGTQRRAIGNVVDVIEVADALEMSPAASVNQLISQRSPGVQLMPASGLVGAGAPIHIRGLASLELGATPIIYIDGIRMDSRHSEGPSARGGSRVSRLDDLNLDDVASIEIIKGPAAATLYGTEASNGVIQIITKRGSDGRARFDVTTRFGTNWLWNPEGRQGFTYALNPVTMMLDSVNIYAHERDHGLGDPFSYGSTKSYAASVRGGTDLVRYFVSASWSDEVGVWDYNWQKHLTTRSNIDFMISDQLDVAVSMGYVQRTYRGAQLGLSTDAFGNMTWGSPNGLDTPRRGYLNAPPEAVAEVEGKSSLDRVTASLQIRYRPWDWFTHRLVTGIDVGQDQTSTLYPRHPDGANHWWGTLSLGSRSVSTQNNRIITLDYGAAASAQLLPDLLGTTSIGLQYYRRRATTIGASGTEFAAPPLITVSAGAIRSGSEEFTENATAGLYIQQQFEWRNRVFLTGALRADNNSAFGAEFDAAIYPKLSATWVVHEEPFWNLDWLNQFRLRAAWGAAGQQPSTFAAVRLYSPVTGHNDEPGLQPAAIGNAELKPERSEELELGFDASLLNNRIEIQFTRYNRTVRDALVDRALPISEGFPGSQTVNVAKLIGWGNELMINAHVLEGSRVGWTLGGSYATMHSRVESLGGLGAIGTGTVRHVEGFSIADIFHQRVLSADFVNGQSGPVTNLMCDGGTGRSGLEPGGAPVPCEDAPWVWWGHSQPTWQANFYQTLRLWDRLRLHASVDASGGNRQIDNTEPAGHTTYCTTRPCQVQDDPIFMAYRAIGRTPLGMYKAGFARLREASATYTLPQSLVSRFGADGGSISLAGRNLIMLWTAEEGWNTPRDGHIRTQLGNSRIWDPEVRATGAQSASYQTVLPPLASAVLTVRLSF